MVPKQVKVNGKDVTILETIMVTREVELSWDRGQDALCRADNEAMQRKEESLFVAVRNYKAGLVMSQGKLSEQKLQEIRELAAGWGKIVARRVLDGAADALDLSAMEQLAATERRVCR